MTIGIKRRNCAQDRLGRWMKRITAASWKYRAPLFLALLAVNPLILSARAEDMETDTEATEQQGMEETGNEELLLFWEKKELYVQTATRTAKPISQVAENIEVITAKDIEDMNAHTVAEVLNRVPGLFVDFGTNEFNSPAQLHIQGGASRHVTVLLDNVVWNFLSDGHAETIDIPIGIIDRIEIIKGPASSAWGSGLSGVINIITKNPGDTTIPKGMVTASFGEADTRDYHGQLFGKVGKVRYFLHAGRNGSDGLRNDRDSRSDSLYAKVAITPVNKMDLQFTVGYTTPDLGQGSQHTATSVGNLDTIGRLDLSSFHATGSFEYRFLPEFAVKAEANTVRFRLHPVTDFTSPNGPLHVDSGDSYSYTRDLEEVTSGNLRFTYNSERQYAVLGTEISHGEDSYFRRTVNPRASLTSTATVYSLADVSSAVDKWAIFANDTFTLGNLAITPGIRLDHNSLFGSFISPSFGATYQFSEHSIARLAVARGFTYPPFAMTSGGGAFWFANPNVTAEQGWSYQAGVESALMDYVNVKGTLFRHDINNAISDEYDATQRMYINVGKIVRQGYELSAESAPIFNTSLKVANSYVHIDPDAPFAERDNYSYLVGLKYDDRKAWLAQVVTTYVWWDLPAGIGSYNDFVWDANLNRRFQVSGSVSAEVFFNIHNIFSAPYTTLLAQPNPGRWVEGGVKCRF